MRFVVVLAVALGGLTPPARVFAQQEHIALTEALSPADERKAFTVPAGFEVQLVAAEPDIGKPMQMAFDAKGRLWVTTSRHYPFAAPPGQGTDKLFVLSDFDDAGKAKTVVTFAADLNIPIGILPLPDGKSCIVSSAGEIRKLTDTDGDGKADKSEVLFGGFGTRDTHGMYNSFILMPDGWVYACHGYNNLSKVKGKDGHEVEMHSGNTFRFRPDGSRIEVYTRGQVNPFGMTTDPWFNLYTADCHTKPITQLIPGAFYDSFGKPHDGLGYGPHVTRHDHGSTALCGLAWYAADQFPKEYTGTMFLGNVVTNRVNCDRIEWKGSTPVAVEQPDFLVSKDPWFRPVDIKLGPDGALYVADFYNRIIGHYEVDLKHPMRDKDRGRVWRIVWKNNPVRMPQMDWPKAENKEVFANLTNSNLLDSSNLTVRMIAIQQMLQVLQRSLTPEAKDTTPEQLLTMFVKLTVNTHRTPAIFEDENAKEFRNNILTVKAMASTRGWDKRDYEEASKGIANATPRMKRVWLEAVAAHPHPDFVVPLIELLMKCPEEDTHLKHAARVALRNCLRDDPTTKSFELLMKDDPARVPLLADAFLGISVPRAAAALARVLGYESLSAASIPAYAEHIARYGNGQHDTIVRNTAWRLTWTDGGKNQVHGYQALRRFLLGVQARGKGLSASDIRDFGSLSEEAIERLRGAPATAKTVVEVFAQLPRAADPRARADAGELSTTNLAAIFAGDFPDDVRVAAAEGLGQVGTDRAMRLLIATLNDPKTNRGLWEKVLVALAGVPSREARGEVKVALKGVPYRLAVAVALNMATTAAGAEEVFAAVKAGFLPARVLQEKAVVERMRAANVPDFDKQLAELTRGLPPADQKLAALVAARAKSFASAKPDVEKGAKLFTQHCAACHRVGDQGGKVAPNLDGIGTRGLERLLEDTLDPNRNVDAAFRARVITKTDGTTFTGLMLKVEGEVLVLADDQGKEVRIPLKDIEQNRETALSPMPANVADLIPENEFPHLMGYLLSLKAKQ